MRCAVTGAGEQLGDRYFPLRQSLDPSADRHRVGAGTNGKASSQSGRAARSALRFNVEVGQSRAFSRELIDARRSRAAEYAAPVTTHFAITQIVHQDEHNVRFLGVAGGVL